MAAFSVDASCMVAAVCAWHARHGAAAAAIETRLEGGETLVVPAHALVETYGVLTRLPAPHRLAPADAWTLVEANFVRQATVAGLAPSAIAALLARMARLGIGGGRVYDALIAASASGSGATTILTLNPRHFAIPGSGVIAVEPGAGA